MAGFFVLFFWCLLGHGLGSWKSWDTEQIKTHITKETAGERGNANSRAGGGSRQIDKQGMQVKLRVREERKEWTRWIHKQNFGRGGGALTGAEKIMALDGG